jgi:hypothetical protein
MTDSRPRVVVPYADFLEHREQRRVVAAEQERQDIGRTIDTQAVSVVVAVPSPNEGGVVTPSENKETDRADSSSPAQNAERIT